MDARAAWDRWHPATLAVFAALAALLMFEVALQGKVFVGNSDRVLSDLPYLQMTATAVAEGSLPHWNPYTLCGSIGVGQYFFRPLHLPNLAIARWFPHALAEATSWRIVVEIFLHLLLFYLFFAKVWQDRSLAVLSSLIASLNIFTMSWFSGGHSVPAFMGLVLWVLWDWEERDFRLNVVCLSLALFLQLASSSHQFTAYGVMFAGVLSASRCAARHGLRSEMLARLAGLWTLSCALAACLDAVELIPFLEAQRLSNRTGASFADAMARWGQPWYMALRLAFPDFLGGATDFARVEGNYSINYTEAFAAYGGAGTLLLCGLGAAIAPRASAWPWAGALAALTLCSLRTPFAIIPHALFVRLPFVHSRLALLVPWTMAFLAPMGLRAFAGAPRRLQERCVAWAGFATVLGWALATGAIDPAFSLHAWLPSHEWSARALPAIPERLAAAGWRFLAFAGAVAAALFAHERRWLGLRGLTLACSVAIGLDLFVAARRHAIFAHFSEPGPWYPEGPATRFLRDRSDLGLHRAEVHAGIPWAAMPGARGFEPSVNVSYRVPIVGGYASFMDRRFALLAGRGSSQEYRGPVGLVADTARRADLFAVKYVVAPEAPGALSRYGGWTRRVFEFPGGAILEKLGALPRVRLACAARETPDSAEEFLREWERPDLDPSATVFIEERGLPPAASGPCGRMEILEQGPQRVRVKASLERPGFLVVTETHSERWRATVDGRPEPLLRANFAFQAVRAPAGESEIDLRFVPSPGARAATAGAAALLLALAAGDWFRRRRSRLT